ncbi:MAG TPA: InlB B-repeat-containing protein [Clostridia bacterium]|nr:InlB B-repeat-containing protein [Clostridia bacterium]
MSKAIKIIKKSVSLLMVCALIFQLMPVLQTSAFADVVSDDIIGRYDYEIENPYEAVNWDTWQQYKAVTHAHSHQSDGDVDFNKMIEAYYSAGYDGVGMTDHGTVNYGWTAKKSRLTIFGYQFFVHGKVNPLSTQRNLEITTGVGRGGRGMIDIPLGIELNGAATSKCHVNSFFADCGHGDLGMGETWPANAVKKSHNAGGLTHINHIGEWGGDAISNGVYNDNFVRDLANLFLTYSSCVGMELVNKSDGRTKHDRGLYDKTLQILAPLGRNIFGFCEDDSHKLSDIGRNAQFFCMPSNTAENVRTSMETGAFFASSKHSNNELGDGFSATGEFPTILRLTVDEVKDQINITCKYANEIKMVADGNVIKTISTPTSETSVTIDLNEYEDQIGSYVRIYLTGPGGITYVQPFLLTANERPISSVSFSVPSPGVTVVVKNSNNEVIEPNDVFKYYLEEGEYTYSASKDGYIIDEGSFEVTEQDILSGIQKTIKINAIAKISHYKQNAEGALLQSETIKYKLGQNVSAYAKEFKGYEFSSFKLYTDGVLTNEGTEEVSTVLNATSNDYQWKFFYSPKSYSVNFNTNGGGQFEPIDGSGNTAIYGEIFELASNSISRVGYSFAGWLLEQNETVYLPGANIEWVYDTNATFVAQWMPNIYNVSYNANGIGGFIPVGTQLTVAYNSFYNLPTNYPIKTGYTITGWKLDLNGKTYGLTETVKWTFDSNGTFTAVWAANQYNVVFNDGIGGSGVFSLSTSYNEDLTLPEYSQVGLSRYGYVQIGWEIDGTVYEENDVVRNLATNNGDTVTVQAVWQELANLVQISFDANGGNSGITKQDGCVDDAYGYLPVPERLGYTFGGWYTIKYEVGANVDQANLVTESTIITNENNHTLYAYWIANEYRLTVNPNGGTWGGTSEATVFSKNYNAVIAVPNPVRTGYSFGGWSFTGYGDWNSATSTYTFSHPNSSQASLTANWAINSYKFIISPNGGEWNGSSGKYSIVQNYGTTFKVSGVPSRTGYSFNGWSFEGDGEWDNASLTYVFNQNDSQPDTLTANWAANTHQVIFADITGVVYGVVQVDYGTTLSVSSIPDRAFEAARNIWYTDTYHQNAFVFSSDIITGDLVLYGKVQPVGTPKMILYEKTEDIGEFLLDKSEKPEDIGSFGGITYMDITNEYDYYCYTNSNNPLMLLNMGLNGVEGDFSIDTFAINIDVLSKSAGVISEGAGETVYSSNADGYKYTLLTPTFTGTNSREFIVYEVTLTQDIEAEIVTLSMGTGENGDEIDRFTVCVSYFNTNPQAESNFEGESVWKSAKILNIDTMGAMESELLSGNDGNYIAFDPIYGRVDGAGTFYYVLNENVDAAIIAEYFNGDESLALNSMYNEILNGNRNVENVTNSGEYSLGAETTQATVNKDLVYVHIVDKWGNVFDGFLRLPNTDNESAQLSGNVNGVLNINEVGGSQIAQINIFKYKSNDLLEIENISILPNESQSVDMEGNVDIIKNVLVIKIDSDIVRENKGKFKVLVIDKAGNSEYVDVYVLADGLLIINIFDEFNIGLQGGEYYLRNFVSNYSYVINSGLTVNLFTSPDEVFLEKVNKDTVIDRINGIITGLEFNMTSLDGFVQTKNGSTLECLPTQNGFGTGTVVNVLSNGLVIESFVIVIFGDLGGNGNSDAEDCLMASFLVNGMLSEQDVDNAVYQAADANHDGVVDFLDAQLMELSGLFISNISQTP